MDLGRRYVEVAGDLADASAVAASQLTRGGVVWVGLGSLQAWLRRDRGVFFETAVATWLADGLALGTSRLVGRARPCARGGRSLIDCPQSPSFPSQHAAAAFAGALTVSRGHPMLRAVLVPAAIGVAASRVRTGVPLPERCDRRRRPWFARLTGGTPVLRPRGVTQRPAGQRPKSPVTPARRRRVLGDRVGVGITRSMDRSCESCIPSWRRRLGSTACVLLCPAPFRGSGKGGGDHEAQAHSDSSRHSFAARRLSSAGRSAGPPWLNFTW